MKKFLLLAKFTFLSILVFLISGPLSAQTKLIYVCDTNAVQQLPGEDVPNDTVLGEQVTIDIFLEDGYDVQLFHTNDGDAALSTYPQEAYDELDGADLIYIGRRVPSFSFDSPDKELWNDLYPPIMTENMWALRNSRMNWFNTTDIVSNVAMEDSAIVNAVLEDPGDQLFDGLEDMFPDLNLSDSIPWWYGQWNVINPGDVGNGTVMATMADGYPVWVRFEDREEFYSGSVDEPAGERVYFGLAADNDGAGHQFYSRFAEVAKEIFLREAARLSGHEREDPSVKAEEHQAAVSKVYFNAERQKLVVQMENLNRVEVIDLSGKLVYVTPAESDRMSIDLGFVDRGIYLVKLTDKDRNYSTKKILK